MNRNTPALASLFAAGAFVATAAVPAVAATPMGTSHASAFVEAGCGAKDAKKDAKDAKCGKDAKTKKDAPKKDAKDASCGKGSCGSKKG